MDKVLEIFYNFFPGFLYLSIWILISNDSIKIILCGNSTSSLNSDFIFGTGFVVISLALGFIIHGILRIIKKIIQIKYIRPFFSFLDFINRQRKYYSANRWLWANNYHNLTEFFSTRSALFGNLFVGGLITIIIFLSSGGNFSNRNLQIVSILIMFGFTVFSAYLWGSYSNAHVDTVIKTYDEIMKMKERDRKEIKKEKI